jgi:hypothetical protein
MTAKKKSSVAPASKKETSAPVPSAEAEQPGFQNVANHSRHAHFDGTRLQRGVNRPPHSGPLSRRALEKLSERARRDLHFPKG